MNKKIVITVIGAKHDCVKYTSVPSWNDQIDVLKLIN